MRLFLLGRDQAERAIDLKQQHSHNNKSDTTEDEWNFKYIHLALAEAYREYTGIVQTDIADFKQDGC